MNFDDFDGVGCNDLRGDCEVSRRGRGRPRKDVNRKSVHTVRFNEEEENMLTHLEIESDDNISEILRKALRLYYRFESNKW